MLWATHPPPHRCAALGAGAAACPGLHQRLRIAANDVRVAREAPRSSTTIINVFPARIKTCFPLDASEITLVLALGTGGSGTDVLAPITRCAFDTLRLKDGMDVFAQLKHVSLVSASEAPLQAPEASTSAGSSRQPKRRCLELANKRTKSLLAYLTWTVPNSHRGNPRRAGTWSRLPTRGLSSDSRAIDRVSISP